MNLVCKYCIKGGEKMVENALNKCAEREARVMAAVHLETPDRVPFMPHLGNVCAMGYGISMYDAMRGDLRPVETLRSFCRDVEPDWLEMPGFIPARALELAEPINMSWATEDAPDAPFQYADHAFIDTDQDWEDYLRDPSLYLLTRVLPEKYKGLEGLKLLSPYSLCAPMPMGLASASAPPLRAALLKLLEITDAFAEDNKRAAMFRRVLEEEGIPSNNGHMLSPFDEFGDALPGLVTSVMELVEEPERYMDAVERWGAVSIPAAIRMAKMSGAKMVNIPLHMGIDEFMSPANYEKYYWPILRRMIDVILDAGMTPHLITEGNYNTRLEQLCDVPKGKVLYSFDRVDMKRAKEVLGGTACVMGNLPTSLLLPGGKKEKVIDETKRLIDECAPGGGYIMSCSMPLDNVDMELVRVWKETTFTYGKY